MISAPLIETSSRASFSKKVSWTCVKGSSPAPKRLFKRRAPRATPRTRPTFSVMQTTILSASASLCVCSTTASVSTSPIALRPVSVPFGIYAVQRLTRVSSRAATPARSPRRRTPGRRAERSARVCARLRARLSRRRARPGVRTGTSARSVSSLPPDAYVEGVQSQNEVQKPRDFQKDVAVFRGGKLRVLRHGEAHELGAEAEYARPHVAEAEEDREQPLARIPEAVEVSAQSRACKEHQKDCHAA